MEAAVVAAAQGLVLIALFISPGETEKLGPQKFHQGGFAGFVVTQEKHQAQGQVLYALVVVNAKPVDV